MRHSQLTGSGKEYHEVTENQAEISDLASVRKMTVRGFPRLSSVMMMVICRRSGCFSIRGSRRPSLRAIRSSRYPRRAEIFHEGRVAVKLLAAAGQEICLGYSEKPLRSGRGRMVIAVILDGEGLQTHVGIADTEVFAYGPVDVPFAIELLQGFPKENNYLVDG